MQKTEATSPILMMLAGNRISKIVQGDTTIYVRDAGGNVLSVYERRAAVALQQSEMALYGNSRLGLITRQTVAPIPVSLSSWFWNSYTG